MDPLSDVLRSLRLTGGVFLDASFTAPWAVLANIPPEIWKPYLSAPTQMIAYHVVVEGRLLLSIDNEAPLEVGAGEIVLVPRNDWHTLASANGLRPVNGSDLIVPSEHDGLFLIRHGGGGAPTKFFCGFLGSEDAGNPLLQSLPRAIKVDVRQGTSYDWIEASVRFAASELANGRLATSSVMSRLSECLLAEAVRQHLSARAASESGWLKGLTDPQVGRALALIHQDIAVHWTAEGLAREVAMSRSAFMERFTSLVGMPPIRYLSLQRLHAARLQLRESARSVAQIAFAVGYESEEAFSRAFKREFGLPPARWRERKDGA
jgi:AraC-like DNA-binding protein